jgi:hypothetical protein
MRTSSLFLSLSLPQLPFLLAKRFFARSPQLPTHHHTHTTFRSLSLSLSICARFLILSFHLWLCCAFYAPYLLTWKSKRESKRRRRERNVLVSIFIKAQERGKRTKENKRKNENFSKRRDGGFQLYAAIHSSDYFTITVEGRSTCCV